MRLYIQSIFHPNVQDQWDLEICRKTIQIISQYNSVNKFHWMVILFPQGY
jgi:hypothetical protein